MPDTYHGGAPRVRRRNNNDDPREKGEAAITINTDKVMDQAIGAGIGSLVSLAISRVV